MPYRLDHKVALVSGAGRGIGRAIAEAFGGAGASVGCMARTLAEVDSTAAAIEGKGGRGIGISADVRDPAAVAAALDKMADTFGGLDVVVINAGVNSARGSVEESDSEEWRDTVETNLLGAYYCAKAAVPHLKRRGAGKIITIGSGLGHNGAMGASAYSASKAGLWMLTRVLAQEVAQYNISVNELIPGPVRTSFDVGVAPADRVALPETEWFKSPEDVVPLALFLASQPDHGPTAQSFSLMRRDR